MIPASASTDSGTLATGKTWSVTRVAGGYEVTVDLPKTLPIRSDAPTIVVDGKDIGIATESDDGRQLSVTTSDPAVASADSVVAGWASSPDSADRTITSEGTADLSALMAAADADPVDADPGSTGSIPITESIYKFGDQAIPLAGIGGIRGELEGKIYLPDTGGARPTVIFLHGRHGSCYGGTPNPNRWPCGADQNGIPSYLGYEGPARALASHGYAVVSISANAINSNDNQLALDQGAEARGQLILDTLSMLDKANKGQPVEYHDAAKDQDVTLGAALSGGLTPSALEGRFDLTHVGLMGHSRGGEGVTSAATLNNQLPHPWGIKSILPLAPVDFGRMTIPDVAMNVMLPYCDGDVSNQQGQHMLDDSRYGFDDNVLRSSVWVMGANHNFFNTIWTPGLFPGGTGDDWSNSTARTNDPICGTSPAVAATSIRLSAADEYKVGTNYVAGWFRLTLGHENQFLPMFDGSGSVPESLAGKDIRSVSTAPAKSRATITSFERTSSLVRTVGDATAAPCASLFGRTVPAALPYCSTTLGSAQVPLWTPASNAGNVPATPVTRMTWTSGSGELRVSVPTAERDASGFERLSVKLAADESVNVGTDLTMSVLDGSGHTYTSPVSALNPYALVRLPSPPTTNTLKKIVLQQVNVPTSALADAGLTINDIREVRFTAAVGADAVPTGAAYLSDLAFENSSVGQPVVKQENGLSVAPTTVAEGDGPGTADVAVYLSEPAASKVVGYVSVLGSATGRGGIAMEKVTFEPGETCKVVTGPILGDDLPSTTPSTAVKMSVTNTAGAVMSGSAFANLTIAEDDGLTGAGTPLPPSGKPGDPCLELAALSHTGVITVDDATPAPGGSVVLTASGYRPGEGVAFILGDTPLGTAVADASGTVVFTGRVPADEPIGPAQVTAVGAGSGFTSKAGVSVLTETATTLSMSPEIPDINESATLTAQVSGPDTEGSVEFFDGGTSLGIAPVTDGQATLTVGSGFKAGTHPLTAVFGQTESAQSSTSNVVTLNLVKGRSGIALVLASDSSIYGSGVKGSVAVANGDHGTVTLSYGGTSIDLALGDADSATFSLPKTLAAGSYDVSAVFNGTDKFEPSGVATVAYTVTKKATTSTITSKSTVKRGKTLAVKTTVKGATAGTYPTGTVKIYVKVGTKYVLQKTVALSAAAKGAVSTSVKAPSKKTTIRIKAVYSGNGNYAGSTSASKAVKVG